MPVDISALKNAIEQLDTALEYAERGTPDPKLAVLLRSAAIQAFEFTYELAHKTLRRYLASIDPSPELVEDYTFEQLIRRGNEAGLLSEELVAWKDFRKNRGITSHGYDEEKAQFVYENIATFLPEVKYLANKIQTRQQAG